MTETRYYAQIETRKTGRTGVYEDDMTNWFAIYEVGVADAIEFHKLPYEANRNAAKTLRELGWELTGELDYIASINVERGPVRRITEAPESPRVGERVTYKVGRRTVNATVTRLANEDGEVGVVVDGDQTGSVRHVAPALLTVQAPDMDKLHEAALSEDHLRNELLASVTDEYEPSRGAAIAAARIALTELKAKGWKSNPIYWVGRLEAALEQTLKAIDKAEGVSAADTAKVTCSSHHITDKRGGRAMELGTIPACERGTTYGAWSESAGGFVYSGDCATEVANYAADELRKLAKEDDTDKFEILAVCREHEEQPANGCEECNTEINEQETDEADGSEAESVPGTLVDPFTWLRRSY